MGDIDDAKSPYFLEIRSQVKDLEQKNIRPF